MDNLIGESKEFLAAVSLAKKVARFDNLNVWLTGESGTGKEVIAQLVKSESTRKDKPFITVNCGAIPTELVESELFGYVKGAFTGATADRMGLIEAANGGILFLDEVCDLHLNVQVKLLRVVELGEFYRIGARKQSVVDIRWLAASHKDTVQEISSGRFRMDLFYRLAEFTLDLPNLAARGNDVMLYVKSLLSMLNSENSGAVLLGNENAIMSLDFSGNFRGIRNQVMSLYVDAFPLGFLFPDTNCDFCGESRANNQVIYDEQDNSRFCLDCYRVYATPEAVANVRHCGMCDIPHDKENLQKHDDLLTCQTCTARLDSPIIQTIHTKERTTTL